MTLAHFPAWNASFDALSAAFIAAGWWMIRRERKTAHAACMGLAVILSLASVACCEIYRQREGPMPAIVHFGTTWTPVYYYSWVTHCVLALAVAPLVAASAATAVQGRWEMHRSISRWTLPLWLCASMTGLIMCFMLHRWFPDDKRRMRVVPLHAARPGAPLVTR